MHRRAGFFVLLLCCLAVAGINARLQHAVKLSEAGSTDWFSYPFDANYLFSWQLVGLDTPTPAINAAVSVQGQVWVGFGLSPKTGGMVNADMIIARFDLSPPNVNDYYATAHATPSLDTQLGDASANMTYMNWTRLLTTNDTAWDWPITSGYSNLIFAYGSSNTFGYHGGNRGQVSLDLFTGQAPPPPLSQLQLPPGFAISVLTRAAAARTMTLSDSGMVYVGSGGSTYATSLYAFNLSTPSTVLTLADDLDNPNGVAWHDGSLFVATVTAVTRYDNVDEWATTSGRLPAGVVLMTFPEPPSTQHSWKIVKIGPDGLVYTSVNSPCNTCNDTGLYGSIIRFSPKDGSGVQVVATGVRDCQGMAWDASGNLFWTDNGRDEEGNLWPPDEFNVLPVSGSSGAPANYGFPLCYGQNEPDPQTNPSGDCRAYRRAMLNLPAHIGALGVLHYASAAYPPPYPGNFFIACHGSWNRQPPLYSQMLFVEVDQTTGETTASIFLRGFGVTGSPSGRIVDILMLPSGSMLVSDDLRGYIYQIDSVPLSC